MRARLAFIVFAIVIAGALAVQNWPEFTRSAPLGIGPVDIDLPLGLVLLSLLAIVLAAFLISAAAQESRHLFEHRRHNRVLHQQRELAEKAETSRVADLRRALDAHLDETRLAHREMLAHIDHMQHLMSARLGELEARMSGRPIASDPPVVSERVTRDTVRL